MPCDSHETALVLNRMTLSLLFKFQNGEEKSYPKERERGACPESKDQGPSTCRASTSSTGGPPVPVQETPPSQEELNKRMEEAEWLEQVGRSQELLPTQQLAQMAAEAGLSMLDGDEPAQKKLWPTMGGKAPWKEFLQATLLKKAPKVPTGDSGSSWDLPVPKEHRAVYLQKALLTASSWNSPRGRQIWPVLPGACHLVSAGSCGGIFGWAHGRCKPLHHTCLKGNNYALKHSFRLVHIWRASSVLKSISLKSVLVFLLVVGCVGFCQYKGWEFSWVLLFTFIMDILLNAMGIDFCK